MSRYDKYTWDTNSIYNPTRMNHIEQGIYDADLRDGGEISNTLRINRPEGTTSSVGGSYLMLGNNTPQGTTGNSQGILRLYSPSQYKVDLLSTSLTADRYIYLPNKAGTIALTSDVNSITTILNINDIPASETSYNCNWQNYNFLFIYSKQYNNIFEQIIVPTSYFSTTSNSKRVQIRDVNTGNRYQVYQNGSGKVYVVGTTPSTAYGLEICGYIAV